MRKMRKMRNCAQLIFVARKICKFAPTRKPVALETLVGGDGTSILSQFGRRTSTADVRLFLQVTMIIDELMFLIEVYSV